MNEIGPDGFRALCEVLPSTGLQTLVCNKNFLGDPVLELFAGILATEDDNGTPALKLKKFDFSTCRLNDSGLIFLIKALENNKTIS